MSRIHEVVYAVASMNPAITTAGCLTRRIIRPVLLAVVLLAAVGNLHADYFVNVIDDGFSFNPDPVNIVTGMEVDWYDDGTGPYTISSDTGAWPPFQTPGAIVFNAAGTYYYADDAFATGTVNVSDNVPPSVSITYPTNNTVLAAPATFTFTANASDTDVDGMSDVEFYVGTSAGTNLVDDVFASPYQTGVTNLPAGSYTLMVIAYDNVYATATNSVTLTVQNPGPIKLTSAKVVAGQFQFTVTGLTVGKTNILQGSTNLTSSANWVSIVTNIANSSSANFTNPVSGSKRSFRVLQLP